MNDALLTISARNASFIASWVATLLEQVRRRVIGPVRVEELVFRRAYLQCSDDWAWLSRLAARRLRLAGADRRLQPALYAPDWRDSILGQAGRPEPGNSISQR